jgi:hydroxymethylpyrimidine/phosphomethylpyrimidine kinase
MTRSDSTHVVVTIAGSDSSGGAGIQADLKTYEAFGCFGMSVVTVMTAQNTQGVTQIAEVDPAFVRAQFEAIQEDFEISAIKIGMLYNRAIIEVVKELIAGLNIPIVIDPVMISKAGSPLIDDEAVEALKGLFESATIITPNLHEAKRIFGYEVGESETLRPITDHATAIVVKNHKIEHPDRVVSVDLLYKEGRKSIFETPYLEVNAFHGTGCSYSSAIAANLALGKSLEESVAMAKTFIYHAIKHAPLIGKGSGPINHRVGGELCQQN